MIGPEFKLEGADEEHLGSDECDRNVSGGDEVNTNVALDIVKKAVQAYQAHTGEPLDPSLIKAEDGL